MEELTKEQKDILKAIAKKGATTPLEISVQQLLPPDRVQKELETLAKQGYVKKKALPSALEPEAVFLSGKGRKTVKSA
jgi:DNA-binding MarR family transcriptional regulator